MTASSMPVDLCHASVESPRKPGQQDKRSRGAATGDSRRMLVEQSYSSDCRKDADFLPDFRPGSAH